MQDLPIYVAVGTVYENSDEVILVHQEYMECETYEQANEQITEMEKRLGDLYPNHKIFTWINAC